MRAAHNAGLITVAQRDALIAFLEARTRSARDIQASATTSSARFDVVHLLWYAGALTITALIYGALFGWAGHHLWTARNLRTPGGLLVAVAISMVPLAIYGIQDALGLWGDFGKPGTVRDFYIWIKGSWLFMEIATIVVAALALRLYRFPFIVLLPAFALWFMSMDIAPWIARAHDVGNFEISRQVSVVFGLAVIAVAVVVNGRQRTGDFAFWLYLFGVLTFWGGVTATSGGTPLGKALYCLLNVGFLFLAVFLGRRVFALFGTIGISIYLTDLAAKVFKDSLLFPFALSLVGVGIIALGLYVHRNQDRFHAWFDSVLPDQLRKLRPGNAPA